MDIQKEKLIAEIENFKTEILKIQVVKVWAESHSNLDPFKHVILEKEDCKVWWMEAQAHQLWETWLAAKAQAVPECTWSRNEDYYFDTSCGNNFMFTECEDKPSEHQFKHCCYCGGKLIEAQEQNQ